MSFQTRQGFWREAFAVRGSVTPLVAPQVLTFGLIAGGICAASRLAEARLGVRVGLAVAPFEFAGAVLGLLLLLRTNAGHERWREAHGLWAGIKNQSRNLAISATAYGPADPQWRREFVRWAAAFPHAARLTLRGAAPASEVADLVGVEEAGRAADAEHMPSFVALRLAEMLDDACGRLGMDRFAFAQLDRERALLIDHVGSCERILRTPLPRVYSIKLRRFILVFLVTLPFALLYQVGDAWMVPLVTMLVAYPLLALDRIGVELENPFSTRHLSHLPLDALTAAIERNLLGVLEAARPTPRRDEL